VHVTDEPFTVSWDELFYSLFVTASVLLYYPPCYKCSIPRSPSKLWLLRKQRCQRNNPSSTVSLHFGLTTISLDHLGTRILSFTIQLIFWSTILCHGLLIFLYERRITPVFVFQLSLLQFLIKFHNFVEFYTEIMPSPCNNFWIILSYSRSKRICEILGGVDKEHMKSK
jgi:hypothetical protein